MTYTKPISFSILVFTFLLATSAYADELSGKDIIDKASQRNQIGFESGRAQIRFDIKNSQGTELNRKLDIKSKKIDGKNRSLITILAPKELQNQAFLFVENPSEKNDIWMYLPAFKVTRRVEGSQKNASFLGSHMTYGDLQTKSSSEGTYKREKDTTLAGNKVYAVTSTPGDNDSPYTKVELFFRQSDFIPLKTVFYSGKDVKKTLYVTKIGKTPKGKSYAKQIVIKVPDGGSTTIHVDSIDETSLPDSLFSKQQLGK